MTPAGRFTAAAMGQVLEDVAQHIGVSCGNARLLRLTNNAVYVLPDAGLVVRITRSREFHDRIAKVAALATWFAEVDAPTVRLAGPTEQPIEVAGLSATVWRYLPPAEPAPTADDLGRVLRELHALGVPPFPLPVWDPVGDARRRLADAEALNNDDRLFLTAWCDRLEPRVAELNQRTQGGFVHADAHVDNLLRNHQGRVVLCDFDATCTGPWQVDLVAVPVGEARFGEARFGEADAHRRLASAYGYDVTADPDWPLLREARELKMVVSAVPLLASAPGVAAQFAVRLRSIANDEPHARWTPYAELQSR
jgi:Ser/Thr protein kinase RdoA (MazF antagonist)